MLSSLLMASAVVASSSSSSSSSPRDSDFIVEAPMKYEQHRRKCNPVERIREFIEVFNEQRYEDLEEFFTEDALRFTNGLLDPATRGRPVTGKQWIDLRVQYPLRFEARQITRSGDWAVAVTGTFFVGGAVEPARGFGLGSVYEFREGDRCLIQVERHHFAHDSIGYDRFRQAACRVFEPLNKLSVCDVNIVVTPSVDISSRVANFYAALANGDASAAAGFFAPGIVANINTVVTTGFWSQASNFANLLNAIKFEQVRVESLIVEGATAQAYLTASATVKATGARFAIYVSSAWEFNDAGVATGITSVTGPGAFNSALELALGGGLALAYWTNSAAAANAAAAAAIVGPPSSYTNVGDGMDGAVWSSGQLRANNAPSFLAGLMAADATYGTSSLWCQAALPVPAAKIDEVRSLADSLLYDVLPGHLWSLAPSIHHCAVDFWLAARVAEGQITIGEAQTAYPSSLASMDADASFRSRVFAELKLLIG